MNLALVLVAIGFLAAGSLVGMIELLRSRSADNPASYTEDIPVGDPDEAGIYDRDGHLKFGSSPRRMRHLR
jgi:hypothetical protein